MGGGGGAGGPQDVLRRELDKLKRRTGASRQLPSRTPPPSFPLEEAEGGEGALQGPPPPPSRPSLGPPSGR
jgi:hypothetical protein